MGWTKEVWRKEVASNLLELSSIEFQKDLWLAKMPGYQSDFTEVICRFNGCGIPDYLDEFIKQGFLGENQAQQLKALDILIDKTGDASNEVEYHALWSSELWKVISKLAGNILSDGFLEDLKQAGEPYLEWIEKYLIV